jgi:DnaK suppressor protein
MKLSEQEKFKPVIEQKLAELRRFLKVKDKTAEPVKPDNAIGRLSRVDAMQLQQMSIELRRQREAQVSRLERALKLIEEGEYGTCPRFEEDIALKRLKAAPDVIFCFDCATALEKRG